MPWNKETLLDLRLAIPALSIARTHYAALNLLHFLWVKLPLRLR